MRPGLLTMIFMKRNFKIKHLLCFYLISISMSSFAQPPKPISYPNALKIALTHNPSLRGSRSAIESAQGSVIETNGMKWPKLSLEYDGARSNNPLYVFGYKLSQGNATFGDFGAGQFTGPNSLNIKPTTLNHPGYYNNFNLGFKITAPLYTGGKISAQQKNAQALLHAAKHGNRQARNQIAYQLLEAYEGVLTANKLVSIAKHQVNQAKDYLNITKRLSKQSITLESDILMAKAYLNSSKIALSNAIVQSQNQLDTFRTILGSPHSTWTPKEPVFLSKSMTNINNLSRKILNENAAIQASNAKIVAEKANILAEKSAYKPQVNLELRHNWNGKTIGSGLPSNIIAIGVQWTLLSGCERTGAVKRAIANTKKAKFELDELRNQLMRSIRQLKRDENQAHYTYQLNKQMVQQENSLIATLKKRFGRGLVPLSALLESQYKLTQARAQKVQALHTQKLMQAQLLMLTNQLA